MDIINRIMLESRYIISLEKEIKDVALIMNLDEKIVDKDINYYLKKFDLKLYNRVISILNKKC